MENVYLTQVIDGQTLLHQVEFKQVIDPEVLTCTTVAQDTKKFRYDNRNFTHSIFLDAQLVTHVIRCETLYWLMPLQYNRSSDEFHVSDDESPEAQHRVGIENCTIIIHTGIKARSEYNMYIVNDLGYVPQVTNIFDDGRMCVHSNFSVATPPENIISTIEASNGNNHLLVNRVNGHTDSRDSTLPVYLKNGQIHATPYSERKLNHEKLKYTRLQNNPR